MTAKTDYFQECVEISGLTLTAAEEDAMARLEARIKINDPSWGDGVNDEMAILRVILAARRGALCQR